MVVGCTTTQPDDTASQPDGIATQADDTTGREDDNINAEENRLIPDDVWEEWLEQRRINSIENIIRGDYITL